MVKAVESQGTKLYVSDGGSPSLYVAVGNIKNIKGPGGSAPVIDVTDLDSTAKEKMMGLPDEGQITFQIKYDPANATHAQMRAARKSRTRLEFKITLGPSVASTLVFYAYVLGWPMDIAVDAVILVDVTLEVDGAVSEV